MDQHELDSLKSILNKTSDTNLKTSLVFNILKKTSNKDSLLVYSNKGMAISTENGLKNNLSDFYYFKALASGLGDGNNYTPYLKKGILVASEKEQQQKDVLLAEQKTTAALTVSFISFLLLALMMLFFLYKRKKELLLQLALEKDFNSEKNKLLAYISHEIKIPSTNINGYLQLINRHVTHPKLIEKFTYLATASNNTLLTKVENIFSILADHKPKLHFEKKVLAPFFENILQGFVKYANFKNIKIYYRHNFQEHISIYFDFDNLEKIITKLISNAIECSDFQKNIFIDVQLHTKTFTIIIKDESFGIPIDEQALLFERFYITKKNKITGDLGMGLYLEKKLVKSLNGTIALKSAEEIGSVFTVEFPIKTKNIHLNIKPIEPVYTLLNTKKEEQSAIKNNLPRVLIVENNLDMIIYLKFIVLEHYNCDFVANGKKALKIVKDIDFDLIISDYQMPVMDGLLLKEALNKLDECKDVPFLLSTSIPLENFEDIKSRLGIEDYINKPYTYEDFITKSNNLLKNYLSLKKIQDLNNTTETKGHAIALIEKIKVLTLKNISNSDYILADLAKDCNHSQKQLAMLIKNNTGYTLVQLILRVRLQKAYDLILNNEYPTLMEVIYAVGLNNRSYFNKKFKKQFGINPSDVKVN